MPRYLTRQKTGAWHYQIAVPAALRAALGKTIICRYIAACKQRDAEDRRDEWIIQDKRLLKALAALPAETLDAVAAAGGWETWKAIARATLREHALIKAVIDRVDQEVPSAQPSILGDALGDAWETGQGRVLSDAGPVDPDVAELLMRRHARELRPRAEQARKVLRKVEPDSEHSLKGLLALWEKVKRPKIARRHAASMALLADLLGEDIDVRTITHDAVARFRDGLEDKSVVVQENHLNNIRAIFTVAVNERRLAFNPAAGIRPRRPAPVRHFDAKALRRRPFTGAQLKLILERAQASLFGGTKRNADVMWVLRLMIWTGCRPREACQLRREDVIVEDGIACVHIRDAHPEQTVKSKDSVRKIPLHPAIAQEFQAYVASRTGGWVFGSFTHRGDTGRAAWLMEKFPRFLDEVCEITDDKLVLYSIRHRFTDAMRNAKVSPDCQRLIAGHAGLDVHDKTYGTGPDLKLLASEIAKVDPLA